MGIFSTLVRRWLIGLTVLGGTAGPVAAQSLFVVLHEEKPYVVQKVYRGATYIQVGQKLKSVRSARNMLVPAEEFFPVFVTVRNIHVKTSSVDLGASSSINNKFYLKAAFESLYSLPDPYLVLEIEREEGGKRTYCQEIGALRPGKPQWVEAEFNIPTNLGSGSYTLHIFSEGREVFHSEQSSEFREQMLAKMVLKRIEGAQDAPPQPLVGPMPEYPAALRKSRIKGEAVVDIHLTSLGVVVDPKLTRATDPAFGEAAMAAIREWRFLPQVTNGRAVATNVSMPFVFEAPAEDERQ